MLNGVQPGGTPLPGYQLVLLILFGPPIMTSLWWVMAGGLSKTKTKVVQNVTDRVAFLTILILTYAVAISVAVYAHYTRR
jgi:ABC-type Na+ efflux pump permease subunit